METKYPEMIIKKSEGASDSECYLIRKCQKAFLSLWSYANLYTDDKKGKELCDVLAVYENHVFIFSDKYCKFDDNAVCIELAWNRWYKHAVLAGMKQIIGAERYLTAGRPIYLDAKRTVKFPISINIDASTTFHRIIVARGIRNASKKYFDGGSGSLGIDTTLVGEQHLCQINADGLPNEPCQFTPFVTGLLKDRETYFHVLDDYTLDCIMDELDTVTDFLEYLEAKEALIKAGKDIIADGEENILAYYLSTTEDEHHCLVKNEDLNVAQCLYYEDSWYEYSKSEGRKIKKREDQKSYLWDTMLENSFRSMMNGTLRSVSNTDYDSQVILFSQFAKPRRVERRVLSENIINSHYEAEHQINRNNKTILTYVRRMSFYNDTLITMVWVHIPPTMPLKIFLEQRREILEITMLSFIPRCPHIRYHIGIAKTLELDLDDSEDFLFVDGNTISDDNDEIRRAADIMENDVNTTQFRAQSVSAKEYSSEVIRHDIRNPWVKE